MAGEKEETSCKETPARTPTEEDFILYARTRDPALRDKIIRDNLHLVPPLVRKFRDVGEHREDLLQVGYIGLIRAVDLFNASRQVKFSTFATHWVMGEIRHYLRDKAYAARRPRWLSGLNKEINDYIDVFLQKNQRLPMIGEVSRALNITEEGIMEIIRARSFLSMDAAQSTLDRFVDVNKIKSLRYETLRLPIEDRILLGQAIERLKDFEQKAIFLFFYVDLTQTQIAKKMGLSPKRVSRMLGRALRKLRDILLKEI